MRDGTIFQNALNWWYAPIKATPFPETDVIGDILKELTPSAIPRAKKLIEQATPFDDIITLDMEYMADFGLGIPVKFIPDILTKTKIIDNKYSGGYYNAKNVQTHLQGPMYHQGVYMLFGDRRDVYYQIFNKKNGKVELVKIEDIQKKVDRTLLWMDETIHAVKRCYDTGNWITPEHTKFTCNLGEACPNPLTKATKKW